MKNMMKEMRVRRSLGVVGLVFCLLMQHGVTQASWEQWVVNELLGGKQVWILDNATELDNYSLLFMSAKANVYKDFHNIDQETYNKKIKEIEEEYEQKKANLIRDEYNKALISAELYKKRRDSIKPFGTLGFRCLSLKRSQLETNYSLVRAGVTERKLENDDILTLYKINKARYLFDITISNQVSSQYDEEVQIYKNRIVATTLLGAAGIAGCLWVHKK